MSDTTVWDLGEVTLTGESSRRAPVVRPPAYPPAAASGAAPRRPAGGRPSAARAPSTTRPPARPFTKGGSVATPNDGAALPRAAEARSAVSTPRIASAPAPSPGAGAARTAAATGSAAAASSPRPAPAARVAPPRATARPARTLPREKPLPGDAMPAIAGSLSMLVPGLGQVALGRPVAGLFAASGLGFLAALGWAIVASASRLAATLPLLGIPAAAAFWTLEAAFVAFAAGHVATVLLAARTRVIDRARVPRVIAVVASLVIPGWGQLLRGRLVRAGFFLAGTWTIAAALLLASAPSATLLETFDLFVPLPLTFLAAPLGCAALAVLVWLLAAWDATTDRDVTPAAWSSEARELARG